jgi:hypothetical protein
MQTRRRAQLQQQQTSTAGSLPHLPLSVQLGILDKVVAAFAAPDSDYTALWPFRSSLGWLLSLQRVCTCWQKHLQTQPILLRRVRLEKLHNLSLLHDYAYYITSSSKSKQQRIQKVPGSLQLQFADNSTTTFDIPKGGVSGAMQPHQKQRRTHGDSTALASAVSGLPTHALLLIASSAHITTPALLELLSDLDTLDKHHAAPMILHVQNSSNLVCLQCCAELQALSEGLARVGASHGGHFASLDAAAGSAVVGHLRDVVKEGDAGSGALTFIPTSQGFCRRVPLAAC